MSTAQLIHHFYDMTGRHLETIETADPDSETGEIAFFHGVDSDEVWYETEAERKENEE